MSSRTEILDKTGTFDIDAVKPINDYILVRVIEREVSLGGIIMPGHSTKGMEVVFGEVLAVGSGITDEASGALYPMELRRGDHVAFMDYAGERIVLRDGLHRLIRCHGVWAKVTLKDLKTCEVVDVEPRMDMLVVEPDDETMTRSGLIYLANENRESQNRVATVVKVGPGRWERGVGKRKPIQCRPGEKVVMMRYGGASIIVNGRKLRILQEDDIRCGFEED